MAENAIPPARLHPPPPDVAQKVPNKFVMKYRKDLLNSVYLKLPSGSEWEVELTRCKDKIWFEKGWPEFSMFCSLDYGSFLVFQYEGNSHFHVCIFDMSATEIDYPITMPKIEEAVEDDDLSIEILEDFQPSPKARMQSPLPCPPYKKMRTSLSSNANMNFDRENTQPCDMLEKPITKEDSHCTKLEVKSVDDLSAEKDGRVTGGSCGTQTFLIPTCHQVLGSALALRRAYDFRTENPSFIVSMRPSDMQSSLALPLKFAKRHLIKQPDSNINLQVLDGSTWSVEFKYSEEEEARFQHGWMTFVKDNNLELGDVCVFVLIKDIKLLLRVVFFRTSEAINWFLYGGNSFPTKRDGGSFSSSQRFLNRTHHEALGMMKQLTATEKANAFKSDKPSFRIVMQPSSIHYDMMSLPNEFSKRYLMKLPAGIAILQVSDGRTWSVKFKYDHANSRARLLKGWSAFVRDNNLKVGDVCVFTLINCIELLFEVAFFPTEKSKNFPSPTGHGRGGIVQVEKTRSPAVKIEPECNMDCEIGPSCSLEIGNKMSKISVQVTQRPSSSLRASDVNLEVANKFSSKNPFFKITIGSGHSVHVPVKFSSSFIKQKKQTVMLQVKDTFWPVNLISSKPCSTSICGGWAAFAKENCLREGDVCIFELIEMNDIVLKVHIFRYCLEGESNVL
ncbi:B3 domain-containing protein LOC_Os12g40080 [Rosa chinensis]|uniref:B3 domain-containing protein LOC_Os12g40080 n=1 Tax=Rosa chinensis TaxID=74649 RepID=UPI001AD8E009|nr:B3 domain-containing protein LOC_Os12g40080 [Rosa chinensis]